MHRTIRVVLGGYAACLIVAIVGVAVFDSGVLVGVALGGILGLFAWAKRTLRCPLCDAVIFLAPVGAALPFILGRSRRCPRCGADMDEATRAMLAGQRSAGAAGPGRTGTR